MCNMLVCEWYESVITQMKAAEHSFPVGLFIMVYRVVLS